MLVFLNSLTLSRKQRLLPAWSSTRGSSPLAEAPEAQGRIEWLALGRQGGDAAVVHLDELAQYEKIQR